MISHSENPTDAQLIKDEAFIRSVRDDLRVSLLEDLQSCFSGFADMHISNKLECLVNDNLNHLGKGDSLPIEYGPLIFNAYSGDLLTPTSDTAWFSKGNREYNEVEWPRPFFPNKLSDKTFTERDNWFFTEPHDSDLKQYLHDPDFHNLHPEWGLPPFQTLPIVFKVALLCRYINEHIISTPSEITAFVLGEIDTVKTFRYIFEPTEDASGIVNGWVIRIHDVRPSQDFGKHVAERIKDFVEEIENDVKRYNSSIDNVEHPELEIKLPQQFEPKNKPRKRSTPDETLTVIAFIDDLIAKGHIIGRGGDMSWDEAAAKLAEYTNGTVTRTGKNLRNSYNTFKQRNGNLS